MPVLATTILWTLITLMSGGPLSFSFSLTHTGKFQDGWFGDKTAVYGNVRNNVGTQDVCLWVGKEGAVDKNGDGDACDLDELAWTKVIDVPIGTTVGYGPLSDAKRLRIGGEDYDPTSTPSTGIKKKATGGGQVNW